MKEGADALASSAAAAFPFSSALPLLQAFSSPSSDGQRILHDLFEVREMARLRG